MIIFRINILVIILSLLWLPLNANTMRIFVSPDGNDINNGTKRAPLATIEAAVEKANEYKNKKLDGVDIEIKLSAGTFRISRPIIITSNQWTGGESELRIQGAGMGKTIISGGIELPSFSPSVFPGIWAIHIGEEYDVKTTIEQLFVNGRRSILARTPNSDSYFIPIKATEKKKDGDSEVYVQELILKREDCFALEKIKEKNKDVRVSVLHYWNMSRRVVRTIKKQNNCLVIEGASVERWNFFSSKNTTQMYLENDISFLDAPGEFYYDSDSRTLYYYPREDESLEDSKAIVPISEGFFQFAGTATAPIANVQINDLTLSYSDYNMPVKGEDPVQAVATKGATVLLDYVEDISFTNVEISHTGLNAIWFRTACRSSRVEKCYLHDLGVGGVKIGDRSANKSDDPFLTRGIKVDNCIIHEGGRILLPAVGIILFKASDCQITHNDIADFYYTGISVGWVWGFGDSPSKRNSISYNHIHHLGWGGLSDMGGIYTLGLSEGTIITNNVIHDVYSYGSDGHGIYLDEGSSGILIKYNFVYKCKSSGFAQHYGRDNEVFNNVFAINYKSQIDIGKTEQENNTLVFKNNVVYAPIGGKIFLNDQWGRYVNLIADENLYWAGGEQTLFDNLDQKTWVNKTGKDTNSIIMDPELMIDNETHFRFLNKKVSKTISFVLFDGRMAGVYGKNSWKTLAEIKQLRKLLFDDIVQQKEIE